MADTPSSSPLGTPFSSSSDTLSWKSTPPSSPDDGYDTPTKKREPPFGTLASPTPSFHLPSRLKAEEPPDFHDLSASLPDEECSKQSGQKHGYHNTSTGHPFHAWRHAPRPSTRLGHVDSDLSRVESGRHVKPSSQTVSAPGSDNQERCIGSEPSDISSSPSDTPDIEPSPTGSSPHKSVDTCVSSPPDLPSVQGHITERLLFEYDISKVSFDAPSKNHGAEAGLFTTHGRDRPRRDTLLGANLTQRRDTPQGRSHARVRDSLTQAISYIPGVHSVEKVERKAADPIQSQNDSIQSGPSHGSRHSMGLNAEISFLDEHEPHHETSMASTKHRPTEEYLRQFSFTAKSFKSILPREMGQLLREKGLTCVAYNRTKPGRCSRNHKGSHEVSELLPKFVAVDIGDAILCINDWVSSVLCKQHRKFAFIDWECWKSIIPTPKLVSNNIEDQRLSLLIGWIQELQEGVKCLSPSVAPGIKSEDDQVDAASKPRATLQQLIPWCPAGQKTRSINQKLREICISPLSQKKDQKSGFIYIYWLRGSFGRMKIGYTKDINKRLQQWEEQCERKLLLHFPKKAEKGDMIPHISRVETLIHAELRDYRREEPRCPKCNRRHREWFEGVSVDLAVNVARKWIDWMRRKPYVLSDYEGKDEWLLSDEALDSLKNVCKPHEGLRSEFCPTKG